MTITFIARASLFAALTCVGTFPTSGGQQDDPNAEALGKKIVSVLRANSDGRCPSDLMEPTLLRACKQQLPQMRRQLRPLGKILEVEFIGVETLQNGWQAAVYVVKFTNGEMLWYASESPSGKISRMYSPPSGSPRGSA